MRFPGGCYIEGDWLRNAFRWKDSIGGWEERPGHLNGEWMQKWMQKSAGWCPAIQCCCVLFHACSNAQR